MSPQRRTHDVDRLCWGEKRSGLVRQGYLTFTAPVQIGRMHLLVFVGRSDTRVVRRTSLRLRRALGVSASRHEQDAGVGVHAIVYALCTIRQARDDTRRPTSAR